MVEDPLKPLAEALEPDPRSASFVGGIRSLHDDLTLIVLNVEVPADVQQLFETAKNVSLYSWFVYRFHQVAESVAFQALEWGLRQRCEADPEFVKRERNRNLRTYLAHAGSRGWISKPGFSRLRGIAMSRVKLRNFIEAFNVDPGICGESFREPTEQEVEKELVKMTDVSRLVLAIPAHRNALAHGSPMVAPSSRVVLRSVADILNQLYPTTGLELVATTKE